MPIATATVIVGVAPTTVCTYYGHFRDRVVEKCGAEVAAWEADDVQIDESLFGRRKYNRGRIVHDQWVFGMCESEPGGKIFMTSVTDRSRATLEPIILSHTTDDAVVYSDLWGAYANLGNQNRQHMTVNHSQNFVDPGTFAHTQRIESMWRAAKRWMLAHGYQLRDRFEKYLQEYVYSYNHEHSFVWLWQNLYS
jgi:transposase-like protein